MLSVFFVTVHGALHHAARHPAGKIAVACIQPLAVRRLFNGLDALQFVAGWAVNCNYFSSGNPGKGNFMNITSSLVYFCKKTSFLSLLEVYIYVGF